MGIFRADQTPYGPKRPDELASPLMDFDDLPYLHGGPLWRVRFKAHLEDFVVEELLGFETSGVGEHCIV